MKWTVCPRLEWNAWTREIGGRGGNGTLLFRWFWLGIKAVMTVFETEGEFLTQFPQKYICDGTFW